MTIKNTTNKKHFNEALTKAITDYGRGRFMLDTQISKGMVNGICAGYRRLSPESAREAEKVTGISKSLFRPDLWA